ncbi:hypothetical protein [Rhodococcoides kyotonense]|uniref:Uncharacterized protein n=1 Tax=Rhodococcoides kyotonense TaxID=398843 RepID=A0A239FCQ0_9NOCA|nr:hypothetical protein [Rhodococcus kyotonensis]SNS54268.1 hypothetical protein SAMN05421642_103216 [Rhodococcus kyotonensis]
MATYNQLTHWQDLAVAADEGQLFLSEDVARKCDDACNQYLEKLAESTKSAHLLANVQGLGTLDSGIELARRLSEKAVGGPNNLVDTLEGHIRVVEAMQVVFRKFFDSYEDADSTTATSIGQHSTRTPS